MSINSLNYFIYIYLKAEAKYLLLLHSRWITSAATSSTYFPFLSTSSNHNFLFIFSSLHYSQPWCHSLSISSSSFYFDYSYFHSITINMTFSLLFYIMLTMYFNVSISTIKIKLPKMNRYRQYFNFNFSLIYYLVITSKLK